MKAAADTERIDFLHHQFLDSCTATILSYDDVEMWYPPESGSARRINKHISTEFSFSSKIRKEMTRISNTINRFASLLQRSLRQNIRNTSVNVLRFGCSAMQAVLFAAIFKSVRNGENNYFRCCTCCCFHMHLIVLFFSCHFDAMIAVKINH